MLIAEGCYAGMHGSTAQSIPNGSTPTKAQIFNSDTYENKCIADYANDKITIQRAGAYLISFTISYTTSIDNIDVTFVTYFNGSKLSGNASCEGVQNSGTGSKIKNFSFTGIADLSTLSDLDIRIRHTHSSSVTITPNSAELSVVYLGKLPY